MRRVDAHNDLLIELVHRAGEASPFAQHYLEQFRQADIAVQVCAMSSLPSHLPERSLRAVVEQAAAFLRAVRENPEVVHLKTAADLAEVEAGDRIGLLLAIEGVEAFGVDPYTLDFFWDLGLRMVGLTWARRNAFADGDTEPPEGGLSALGRELVDLLVERGVIIDLAHANEGTFKDVLARSGDAPVVISHGLCRALFDISRATSDQQLRALADRDGVIGIALVPAMLNGQADTSVERVLDHVDHVVGLVGIDHVGIGSDFMQQLYRSGAVTQKDLGIHRNRPTIEVMDIVFEGVAGPTGFPALADALGSRGYDADAVEAILGGNFLRVLRRALSPLTVA